MNKVEEILNTVKGEKETWSDVFARIDAIGGIDIKTLTKVVIYLLEEQDGRYQTYTYGNQATYSGEAGFERVHTEPTREDQSIQSRTGRIEEETQPRVSSEDGTDTTLSGETESNSII